MGTYYQGNKIILERVKKYCDNNKERLWEQAVNKYRELSNEEKNIKREYGRNRYENMFEKDDEKLK